VFKKSGALNWKHSKTCPRTYSISQRSDRRGGDSLTILHISIQVYRTYAENKDSNLLRTIIHGNKILWICNLNLNQGKVSQIQKVFKSLLEKIPKDELNRVIIIGDLNIDIQKKNNEKVKLLKTLASQLGLKVIEPASTTFGSSKLDFAFASKGLKGKITVETSSLSDHSPIVLTLSPLTVNKDYTRIALPNSKLAQRMTKEALCNASDAKSLLQIHLRKFKANRMRAMKNIKRRDYEMKLFHLLMEKKNVAILEVIKEYWNSLLNENEALRFSKDSAKAFKQLQDIFGYHSFERRGWRYC